MTDKEILELAEQHFDYQGGWIAYSKEDLLEFARAIRKQTIDPYSVKKEALMSIVWILLRNDLLVLKIKLIYSLCNSK